MISLKFPTAAACSRNHTRTFRLSFPPYSVFVSLFFLAFIFSAVHSLSAADETVTLSTLLEEMRNREAVLHTSGPAFTCAQASSYDRNAKSPEENWFANGDASQFIRTEEHNGRTEWVLIDVQGPGAVVRWWITAGSYKNRFHIYIDGTPAPVFSGKIEELIGGNALCPAPLSQETSRGRNLYLPIPYAKSLKITCDEMDVQKNLYYQINYRTYTPETAVESLTPEVLASAKAQIADTCKALSEPPCVSISDEKHPASSESFPAFTVAPGTASSPLCVNRGASASPQDSAPGCIQCLQVHLSSENALESENVSSPENGNRSENFFAGALRNTLLEISFDGKTTVLCPLGDFFGSGVGLNPYVTYFTSVSEDGTLKSFWPMPFKSRAEIRFRNLGKNPVKISLSCSVAPLQDAKDINDANVTKNVAKNPNVLQDAESEKQTDSVFPAAYEPLYFHAYWHQQRDIQTLAGRGTQDWNYVTIDGSGTYVGDILSVRNSSPQWWGEGDEKIYVDDETFPSHFGTGTEDYYGYAWCCPNRFESPWRAQPRAEGPSNFGNTTNLRFRSLDRIPFTKNFRFDLEVWHWAETKINYAVTVFWYGPKDSRPRNAFSEEQILAEAAAPVEYNTLFSLNYGSFRFGKVPAGSLSIQGMKSFPNGEWRNGEQIWWHDGKPGDELELLVSIPPDAKTLTLGLTRACDYGIFEFYLDGRPLTQTPYDACNPVSGSGGVIHETQRFALPASDSIPTSDSVSASASAGVSASSVSENTDENLHRLVIHLVGKSRRSTGTMFGLDFIDAE